MAKEADPVPLQSQDVGRSILLLVMDHATLSTPDLAHRVYETEDGSASRAQLTRVREWAHILQAAGLLTRSGRRNGHDLWSTPEGAARFRVAELEAAVSRMIEQPWLERSTLRQLTVAGYAAEEIAAAKRAARAVGPFSARDRFAATVKRAEAQRRVEERRRIHKAA